MRRRTSARPIAMHRMRDIFPEPIGTDCAVRTLEADCGLISRTLVSRTARNNVISLLNRSSALTARLDIGSNSGLELGRVSPGYNDDGHAHATASSVTAR